MMFKFSGILLFIISIYTHADTKKYQETLAYLEYVDEYWQVFIKQGAAKGVKISASSYDKSTITWLADGENIFVCGIQGDAEIINIRTGNSQSIMLPGRSINDAVISPDGKQVLYSNIAADSTDNKLWLYNIEKQSNKPLLRNMQGRQYDPKWNVKGDVFYFVSGIENTSYGIYQASLRNSEPHSVVINSKYNLDVDISINEKIAYSSNLKNSFDIWVKDDNQVKQITTEKGGESRPSWSQDERYVYFEKLDDGVMNIWSVDVSSDQLKQVTFSEIGARFPVTYKRLSK